MMDGFPTLMLPIGQVGEMKPEDYVGMIDHSAIECLKARMQAEGLRTPIWVRKNGNAWKGAPYSVIAGRHRRMAALELGWAEIAVQVRAGADSKPEELRRLQVSENLDRRVLRPIERACFIMERWREVAQSQPAPAPASQQVAAIRQRWDVSATLANTPVGNRSALDTAVAELSGDGVRNVERYRALYEKLVVPLPDLFAQINAHPLGESLSAMTRLASFRNIPARREAAEMILSKPDWKSMDEVLVAADLAGSTGNRSLDKRLSTKVAKIWVKMKDSDRQQHIDWLVGEVSAGQAKSMVAAFKKRGLL